MVRRFHPWFVPRGFYWTDALSRLMDEIRVGTFTIIRIRTTKCIHDVCLLFTVQYIASDM